MPGEKFADNYTLAGGPKRRAAWRRFQYFPLCCFFKPILATRYTEESHVE